MARDVRNRLVYRIVEPAMEAAAARASGRLLDIGCGEKQWEAAFAPHVTEHVGVDHKDTPHDLTKADLVGSAYALPVEDASFDTVLCTAVLEHLEEPAAALREARRALRDGGVAIYTVPFIWHLHEAPRDFYRYSRYGIEHLFGEAGFEVEELRPLSGFWVTFGTMLAYYLYTRRRGPIRFRLYPLVARVSLGIAHRLDRRDPDEAWTWAYLVVARARAERPRSGL